MQRFSLEGKTALVTGGSRGIGLGIAGALAGAGADLALVARDAAGLERAREELTAFGRTVRLYPWDMGEIDGIEPLYQRIAAETGGIDILVNNAGGTRRGPAEALSLEDWQFVINLNLTSVFAMCRAFGKDRIARGLGGKVINIASLMSEVVREENAPYAASKGGIRQLTKSLAVEWARHGINVNAIGPGFVKTELTRALWEDEGFNRWLAWKTPQGRWGRPEDIGDAAVFLASAASDFVTGQILYVDGGLTATFGPTAFA